MFGGVVRAACVRGFVGIGQCAGGGRRLSESAGDMVPDENIRLFVKDCKQERRDPVSVKSIRVVQGT